MTDGGRIDKLGKPSEVILSAVEIDTFSGRRNVGQRRCVYSRAIAVPKRFILSREQYSKNRGRRMVRHFILPTSSFKKKERPDPSRSDRPIGKTKPVSGTQKPDTLVTFPALASASARRTPLVGARIAACRRAAIGLAALPAGFAARHRAAY